MNWKRGLGIGLLFIGLFLIFTARVLTGAVVGLQKENLLGLVGLLIFIVGIFMMMQGGRGVDGGLEKLFYTTKDKRVRVNDFLGQLQREGIPHGSFAEDFLSRLQKMIQEYEPNRQLLQESVLPEYIRVARNQRELSKEWPINSNSETGFTERFLKEWDPNYVPIKHPLLRPREYEKRLNRGIGVYDTRDILPILESNIGNIKDVHMTSHDVSFKYKGINNQITAGTHQPYETDKNGIYQTLARIATIDTNKDKTLDYAERLDFLKDAVFEA